jgi:cystathionine beta-lyase
MSDFDTAIDRRGSNSYKWDDNERLFGRRDLMPFWVADMDFATPAPILDAIRERSRHPVLGYEIRPDSYFDAVGDWLATRHQWTVPREWMMFCPPSSIVGIHGLVTTLTAPGDSILVPTPNYGPLLRLVADNDRRLLRAPLVEEGGRFRLDAGRIEQQLEADTRMVIISSPHNPTGRVFTQEELNDLAALAEKRELVVISDEVHCDLVLPGHRHTPYGSVGGQRAVTVVSPNKTFNTAGIPQATLIIPDAGIRDTFGSFLNTTQLNHDSTFGAVGMVSAYRHCADWLDRLIPYLDENHRLVGEYLRDNVPGVNKVVAEGTYLAWLDCRALQLGEAEIMHRLVADGGVGLYGGSEFGPDSEGFFRMNIACPRDYLLRGLDGIRRALG